MTRFLFTKGGSILDATDYIMYLKIPSETVNNFYYDVVISFSTTNAIHAIGNDLFDYNVKFFSNDPAFVFTFAHSFIKNKMFFEDLIPKMSKQAIAEKAKVRNPKELIGYVKTLYFAYLFMKDHGYNKKDQWSSAVNYDKKYLLLDVMDADTKIRMRQENRHDKAENTKPKEKKKNFIDQGATSNITRRKGAGRLTRRTNRVNRAKASGIVSTAKTGRLV